MTSIAFYHTLPEEQPFAEQWAEEHHVDVTCFPFELTDETLYTVDGFDGISYKQRFRPSNNPDFYRKLHDGYGIRQIALRSAGIDSIDVKAANEHGIRITNVPSYSPARSLSLHSPTSCNCSDMSPNTVSAIRTRISQPPVSCPGN